MSFQQVGVDEGLASSWTQLTRQLLVGGGGEGEGHVSNPSHPPSTTISQKALDRYGIAQNLGLFTLCGFGPWSAKKFAPQKFFHEWGHSPCRYEAYTGALNPVSAFSTKR